MDREIVRILEKSKITDQIVRDREASIRQKQEELDVARNEIQILNKEYVELVEEVQALKNDISIIREDNVDLKNIIDDTNEKNRDLMNYREKLEQKIADNELRIDKTLKDIEAAKIDYKMLSDDYNGMVLEKEALERHSKILINQNDELTRELEVFVQTDEVLRQQLDRKERIAQMSYKYN